MRTMHRLAVGLLTAGSLAAAAGPARAEDPCIDFKWLLQFSDGEGDTVLLTVTASPPRKL